MANHHYDPADNQKPYFQGRWMVTGPDFEDQTGFSLCEHKDEYCVRCVASFHHRPDARKVARLLHAFDQPDAALRVAIDSINTQLREHGIDMQFNPDAYIQQ